MLKEIYDLMTAEKLYAFEAFQRCGVKKEQLFTEMEEGSISAAVLLLLGFSDYKIDNTQTVDYDDEDTGETITVPLRTRLEEHIFKLDSDEIERIESVLSSNVKNQPEETLRMSRALFDRDTIPYPIVAELADRGDMDALEWMGEYYGCRFCKDDSCAVDMEKVLDYFSKAKDAGMSDDKLDYDIKCIENGIRYGSNIDWVFDDSNLDFIGTLRRAFDHLDYSFSECCATILSNLWDYYFSGSVFKADSCAEVGRSSVRDLVEELILQGVPNSAFHDDKDGTFVNLKNLSFYMTMIQKDESRDYELAVGPCSSKIGPKQQYHCLISDDCSDTGFFAFAMLDADNKFPDLLEALVLVYRRFVYERYDREEKLPAVISILQDIFGEDYSNHVTSVDFYYSYGPNKSLYGQEFLDYSFYKENVCIKFKSKYNNPDHDLNLCYDDFMKLPKDFFVWYSDYPDVLSFALEVDYYKDYLEGIRRVNYFSDNCGRVEFTAHLSDLKYELLEIKKTATHIP